MALDHSRLRPGLNKFFPNKITHSPKFDNNAYKTLTKIPLTAMRYFSSNTLQLAIEVSFAVSVRMGTPSEKSFQAKLSNETSFKMDSTLICTRLSVNQKAPCSRSTIQPAEGFNSAIHSH